MRLIVALAACFWVAQSVAALAQGPDRPAPPATTREPGPARDARPTQPPMTLALSTPLSVTQITAASRHSLHNCHKAWRCGPYDCGWRRVCARSGWRPFWHARQTTWRRHQWRHHYW